jgi:hypothetical protein
MLNSGRKKSVKLTAAKIICCPQQPSIGTIAIVSDIYCGGGPLISGSLRAGSTPAEARAAAIASGYEIPENYIAVPAKNGEGWVFREPGTSYEADKNANTIRVMEATERYPNGYVRVYNSANQAINYQGKPGQRDETTHWPLNDTPVQPPEEPIVEEPIVIEPEP